MLERQEGFEFEFGRGGVCEQAEAVIGQMSGGQTATFRMVLPLPLPPLPGVAQPITFPSGERQMRHVCCCLHQRRSGAVICVAHCVVVRNTPSPALGVKCRPLTWCAVQAH